MKIDKRIESFQSTIIKVITEANVQNREETVRKLEQIGIDNESAIKLVEAYISAEDAKNTSKNVWANSLDSRIDNSTDIAKYQQQEFDTRQYFDEIMYRSVLLVVSNRMDPNEMDDELLSKLHEQGITENQITSPALRIAYHYYSESKLHDTEKNIETDKSKLFSSRIKEHVMVLKAKYIELERENKSLRRSYGTLQAKYNSRIALDEKHYQTALAQISTLKKKVKRLENKSVFQVIGDRLKDRFGNKTEKLPELTSEIPDTLYENVLEKVKVEGFKEESPKTKTSQPTKKTTVDKTYDEWQQ